MKKDLINHNQEENTPLNLDLIKAVENDNFELTKELILKGANPSSSLRGVSALSKAIHNNNLKIVNLLIEQRVDIKTDEFKNLYHPIIRHRFDLAKILINAGSDLHIIDHFVHYNKYIKHALQKNNLLAIKFILEQGVKMNEAHNHYLIFEAIHKDNMPIVKLFFDHDGDLNKAIDFYQELNGSSNLSATPKLEYYKDCWKSWQELRLLEDQIPGKSHKVLKL